jgi:two-component system cell cycle response regulator DivK
MQGDDLAKPTAKVVLIVEDNELNRRLLHDVLEAHGYAILSADRGSVAVEMAREHHPDLILMDIQLPDISGLEATHQLKEDAATRSIPIVAVTAFAMAGDERRTLDAGCDAYIAKPIRLQEFLAIVEKFTGGPVARF